MSYGFQHALSVAESRADERVAFIRRTYAHLAGALLAFVALEAAMLTFIRQAGLEATILRTISGGFTWLLICGGWMVLAWLARSWAHSATSQGVQYLGLAVYVVGKAVLILPLLMIAAFYVRDPNVLPTAGVITLALFGGLTAVVFLTGKDFSFLGPILMIGGFVALGLIIAGIIFGFSLGLFFSGAMILLMSAAILYDTSNVLHHYRTDQHVAAALELFASVAVLFYYVLMFLIQLQGRD